MSGRVYVRISWGSGGGGTPPMPEFGSTQRDPPEYVGPPAVLPDPLWEIQRTPEDPAPPPLPPALSPQEMPSARIPTRRILPQIAPTFPLFIAPPSAEE